MTVGELIKALQAFDQKASVFVPDWDQDLMSPAGVEGVRPTKPADWRGEYEKPETFDGGVLIEC